MIAKYDDAKFYMRRVLFVYITILELESIILKSHYSFLIDTFGNRFIELLER